MLLLHILTIKAVIVTTKMQITKLENQNQKLEEKKVPIFPIPPIFKSLSLLASLKNSYSHTLMKGG